MNWKRHTRSQPSPLISGCQNWLTRHRLLLTSAASGYLFYYVATTDGARLRSLLATWAIGLLIILAFEDWRRYFYVQGRRSGRSLPGKFLS
jgi:hypothetical protein